MDDELNTEEAELQDTNDDLEVTESDESDTPEATESDEGEDELTPAEKAKSDQKLAWLRDIKSGKRKLEDMPNSLNWLKKEVEKDLKPEPKEDELETKIRKTLLKEREQEDYDLLVSDLEESEIGEEKIAELKEEFEALRADGVPQLRALILARKLVGLKDSQEIIRDRRRKAMTLPPQGSVTRFTAKKSSMTPMERKFADKSTLPPAFR